MPSQSPLSGDLVHQSVPPRRVRVTAPAFHADVHRIRPDEMDSPPHVGQACVDLQSLVPVAQPGVAELERPDHDPETTSRPPDRVPWCSRCRVGPSSTKQGELSAPGPLDVGHDFVQADLTDYKAPAEESRQEVAEAGVPDGQHPPGAARVHHAEAVEIDPAPEIRSGPFQLHPAGQQILQVPGCLAYQQLLAHRAQHKHVEHQEGHRREEQQPVEPARQPGPQISAAFFAHEQPLRASQVRRSRGRGRMVWAFCVGGATGPLPRSGSVSPQAPCRARSRFACLRHARCRRCGSPTR